MDTTWHPREGVRRTQVRLLVGGSEGQMRAPLKGAFHELEQARGQEVGHHENGLCSPGYLAVAPPLSSCRILGKGPTVLDLGYFICKLGK